MERQRGDRHRLWWLVLTLLVAVVLPIPAANSTIDPMSFDGATASGIRPVMLSRADQSPAQSSPGKRDSATWTGSCSRVLPAGAGSDAVCPVSWPVTVLPRLGHNRLRALSPVATAMLAAVRGRSPPSAAVS